VLKRRADVLRFPPKNNAWQAGRVLLLRELQTVLNFRTAERQHCITAAQHYRGRFHYSLFVLAHSNKMRYITQVD
jgi:hypothetical protein